MEQCDVQENMGVNNALFFWEVLSQQIFNLIFKFLDVFSVVMALPVNRKFLTAVNTCPFCCQQRFFYRLLIIIPTNDLLDGINWESFFQKQKHLLLQLSRHPSPACEYQKYLRWLTQLPDEKVRELVKLAIFSASLLPQTVPECL